MKNNSIEDALMAELRFGGLDKENLAELVKSAAALHQGGLARLKGNPKGIPPLVDSVRLSGIIDAESIGRFFSDVLPKVPRVAKVVVFPKGIPWPEVYHVELDLGAPVQAPRHM